MYTVTTRITYVHCHHPNNLCFKIGSDDSHFNVCLTVSDKVAKTMSTDHNVSREKRDEAKSNNRSGIILQFEVAPMKEENNIGSFHHNHQNTTL